MTEVEGVANFKRPSDDNWVVLGTGQWHASGMGTGQWHAKQTGTGQWHGSKPLSLPEGSRVSTKLGTKVVLELDDGSKLTLHQNGLFEIVRTEGGKFDFKLWFGDVRSRISKLGPGKTFQIQSPVAVAGVRGTDFLVSVDQSKKTDLSVYEGRVVFKSIATGREADVTANQSATVDAKGTLSDIRSGVKSVSENYGSGGETVVVVVPAADSRPGVVVRPPLSISAPQEGAILSANSVSVLGNAGPGQTVTINGTAVVADGAGMFSATLTLAEGPNVILITAGTEQKQVSVTVDSLRPEITLGAFSELTREPAMTLQVSTKNGATVTAGGVSAVAAGGMATLQVSLAQGDNIITVRATDAKGLTAEKSIRVVRDDVPPVMIVTSLTTVTTGVRVAGLSEAGATVTANGYALDVRSDGSFDQVIADVTATGITFEARDRAGNISRDVRNVTGTVDGDPPRLVALTFAPSTATEGTTVSVTLQVSDASAVASPVVLTLSGSGGGTLTSTLSGSGQTFTGTISIPSTITSGTYSPQAISIADVLGNSARLTPVTALVVTNGAPSAPANISATDATSGGAVTVTWSSVTASDLQGYTLYQGPSGTGPWTPVYSGGGNSYAASGLVDGTQVFYHVVAKDIAGNASAPSSIASATPSDQQAPATPGGLTATPVSGSTIQLSWGAVSGASSYRIYRSLSQGGGGPWSQIGQTAGTSHTVSGLSPGTTYFFSVTACDNNTAPPNSAPNESTKGANSVSGSTQ